MGDVTAADYASTLEQVKLRINNARYQALRSVNKELVGLYWDIGRIIIKNNRTKVMAGR
jgi:hypothetical protein